MLSRTLVLAATLLTGALAQNCSQSLTVTAQTDLDEVAGCSEFEGDITIEGEAGILTINGIQSLTGNLVVNNATSLSSLSAPSLVNISKSFSLSSLTVLSTLSFPLLTRVESIRFQTLPLLSELQFNSGVQEAKEVIISDTRLGSLSGLNLSAVEVFNINNNKNINEISVAITSISNALDISFNSDKVNVSLPSLEWANNATFRFCASVAAPKLSSVNQSLGFINNTLYTINLPSLTKVGQSLSFVSNSHLSNISLPELTSIGGGFQIANNTALKVISGFPKLKTVGGAIDFVGNFSQASLPSLEDVEGGVVVSSSGDLDCTSFDEDRDDGKFHGDQYVCEGGVTSTTSSGSSSGTATASSRDSTATGSASSSSSSNAGIILDGSSSGVFGALLVILFQLF